MKLIINADDAGIDSSRNRGVFDCIENGIVTSVSVIVYQPGWVDLLDRLAENKKAGAGLHVNLTAGRPLVEGHKTLVNERSYFFNKFELFERAHQVKIDSEEVAREFSAQMDKFRQIGMNPSHVDGHNHVHIFPGIREGFLKAISQKMWVRLPVEHNVKPKDSQGVNLAEIYNDTEVLIAVFNYLALESKKLWNNQFRYIDDFCGTYLSEKPTLAAFKKAVERLKGEVCELMCHPGAEADEDAANFSKLKERQKECRILKSAGFKEFIHKHNIELISYKELS